MTDQYDAEDRSIIAEASQRQEAAEKRKTKHIVLAIVGTATTWIIVQTAAIFATAAFLSGGQAALAARIDRGLAYSVCIQLVHPDRVRDEDILRCYRMAAALYPELEPPLPSPALTPLK